MSEYNLAAFNNQITAETTAAALPVQASIEQNIYTENLTGLPIQRKLSIVAVDDSLEDKQML